MRKLEHRDDTMKNAVVEGESVADLFSEKYIGMTPYSFVVPFARDLVNNSGISLPQGTICYMQYSTGYVVDRVNQDNVMLSNITMPEYSFGK